jgi:Uma2 family endonuclease
MELYEAISTYCNNQKVLTKIYANTFTYKVNFDNNLNIFKPYISVICDYINYPHNKTNAPDWIIELVSIENSRNVYVTKLYYYYTSGVREYWIVNPQDNSIFVYYFENNDFSPKRFTFNEIIEVNIFKNLSINLKQFSRI